MQYIQLNAVRAYLRAYVRTDDIVLVLLSCGELVRTVTAVLRASSKPPTLDLMQQGPHVW
jgi:hypothetical protein